ncbi:hypothetical protein GCM10022206_62680 [Streptomyces chiangmaiensis]
MRLFPTQPAHRTVAADSVQTAASALAGAFIVPVDVLGVLVDVLGVLRGAFGDLVGVFTAFSPLRPGRVVTSCLRHPPELRKRSRVARTVTNPRSEPGYRVTLEGEERSPWTGSWHPSTGSAG